MVSSMSISNFIAALVARPSKAQCGLPAVEYNFCSNFWPGVVGIVQLLTRD